MTQEELDDKLDRIQTAHDVLSNREQDDIRNCIKLWERAEGVIQAAFEGAVARFDGKNKVSVHIVPKKGPPALGSPALSVSVNGASNLSVLKYTPDLAACVVTIAERIRDRNEPNAAPLKIADLTPEKIREKVANFMGRALRTLGGD